MRLITKILIIICLPAFLVTCTSGRKLVSVVPEKGSYLNFDKVKVTIAVNGNEHKFRGYINCSRDSFICFRFWGLLGYELGKGIISDNFLFYDAVNNLKYTDLLSRMQNATGLVLNKGILFSLLFNDVDSLATEILRLNKSIVTIKDVTPHNVIIFHEVSKSTTEIKYTFGANNIKCIAIKSVSGTNKFELKLEIVEISREKKICRFNI